MVDGVIYYERPSRGSDQILSGMLLSPVAPHEDWSVQHALAASSALDSAYQGMWQLSLQNTEGMEPPSGPYPERPGEPDCVYYMRTGLCGFGMSCRFNHPPNRKLAAAMARGRGDYPERVGQPECQYYLKTGTCKFGATCKYHHPRDKGGQFGSVQLNILGLPFRLGEKECAYYMRTGSCKYGSTCKFHHPQPATAFMSVPSPSLYAPAGSPSAPVAQHYPTGLSSWPITRGAYLPSPRLQGPTSYAPLIIPSQGIVSIAGWSNYPGSVAPVTPAGQQQMLGATYPYGGAHQAEPVSTGGPGGYGSYSPGSFGLSSLLSPSTGQESPYPERPGLPECQYYMKTGDCKFGPTCRYHHPKEQTPPSVTKGLSQMGLPLRPGAPPCSYYIRYHICKFGPTCKFDHPPLGALSSSPSTSSLTEMANVSYSAPSANAFVLNSSASSEMPVEIMRRIQVPSKDLATVSDELTAHDQLDLKKDYEKVNGSVNSSREIGASSIQTGQSLTITSLENDNQASVTSLS